MTWCSANRICPHSLLLALLSSGIRRPVGTQLNDPDQRLPRRGTWNLASCAYQRTEHPWEWLWGACRDDRRTEPAKTTHLSVTTYTFVTYARVTLGDLGLPESRGCTPIEPSYEPWVAGPPRPTWHRRTTRRAAAGRIRRADCSGGCSSADRTSATPSLRFSDPLGCRWCPLTWDLAVGSVAAVATAAATSSSSSLLFLHAATTFFYLDGQATRSFSFCCSFCYSFSCSAPHRPRIIVSVLFVTCNKIRIIGMMQKIFFPSK